MPDDPDGLVDLTTARTEFEAETIAETLRGEGVPTEVFGISARTAQWELGINTDMKIVVRRKDVERAREILRANKADSVDLDWDEVDVGQPTAEVRQARTDADIQSPGDVWKLRLILGVIVVVLGVLLWGWMTKGAR